jgi:hypothetical protein
MSGYAGNVGAAGRLMATGLRGVTLSRFYHLNDRRLSAVVQGEERTDWAE